MYIIIKSKQGSGNRIQERNSKIQDTRKNEKEIDLLFFHFIIFYPVPFFLNILIIFAA
jgi:hypothetical protein